MSRATKRQNVTAFLYDKRGRLLAVGRNSYTKTHPLQARMAAQTGNAGRIYLHAEIAALVRCEDWGKIDTLEVHRYNVHGQPLLAKPCPVCQRAIELAGIKKVVYTIGARDEQ